MKRVIPLAFALCFISIKVIGQDQKEDKPTILREAGDYSEDHNIVTIAVFRGTHQRAYYDRYINYVSNQLDSLQVPHKFFQKYHDKVGTGFCYFIENDLNGVLDANEFLAILPHIKRRYEMEYKAK